MASCNVTINCTSILMHDAEEFVKLIKSFISVSVFRGSVKPTTDDIICRQFDFGEFHGVEESNLAGIETLRKFMSGMNPQKVLCDHRAFKYLQHLSQPSVHLIVTSGRDTPISDILRYYGLARGVWNLEVYGALRHKSALNWFPQLTHLSIEINVGSWMRSVLVEYLNKLEHLLYLDIRTINGSLTIEHFLEINARIPSLKGFRTIGLGDEPYDIVVSKEHQQSFPSNCKLERLQTLQVSLPVLGISHVNALVEAMVYSFTGIKRLLVDVTTLMGFKKDDLCTVLNRANGPASANWYSTLRESKMLVNLRKHLEVWNSCINGLK
ncbi:hypothetical protein HDU76_004691 [Blyttiomyces sp. JEL0837]|nr:hypothetical protein HDU76_004691 [Blyttiomyces sp. JEL0837]